MLQKYAELLIQVGLHVKNKQIVVIQAPVEVYDFVQRLVPVAFQAGAKDVIVRYRDEVVSHQRYRSADADVFGSVPSYDVDFYNQLSEQGACFLTLVGGDPDLMKDVDPARLVSYASAFRKATKSYRRRLDFMECQWCIGAVATRSWAQAVYPEDPDCVQKLWADIFTVARVREDWNVHKQHFQKLVTKLNALQIRFLQYRNRRGTNLMVELPKGYRFEGGGSILKDQTYYFPNIPTEEVFSAPLRTGVNGILYASMPLCHQGSIIDDFWFVFQDGKVIDFDAKKGKNVLERILSTDEGACYLGEIALVPYGSPISSLHKLFYETLIDENASCHFALGQSYPECIAGGLQMNEQELLVQGLNQSLVHVDFMVGTSDLSIVAQTHTGKEIPIFINGNYSSYFTDKF